MDDLYFIQATSGPVKIGRGINPAKRVRELQIGCFEKLELAEALEGRGYEERAWHKAFKAARLHGEWYQYTDELDQALFYAKRGKPWWNHLAPPPDFPVSDDRDDDFVDWQIGIHLAVAGAAEKAGLDPRYGGRALCEQDNAPPPKGTHQ